MIKIAIFRLRIGSAKIGLVWLLDEARSWNSWRRHPGAVIWARMQPQMTWLPADVQRTPTTKLL